MLVDVATVAQALELTPRRVQQLVKEGWLPREETGRYDLADCLTGYASYLEEVEGRKGVGGAIDRARARKFTAQAEIREINLAVEAGELVEGEEARASRGKRLTAVRANLLNLPSVAPRLEGLDREEREDILREELAHVASSLDAGGEG